MKVIFLDIDGVLNNSNPDCYIKYDSLYPDNIKHLNMITEITGAKIVVSSSWRLNKTVDELSVQLSRAGVTGEIIDVTPYLNSHIGSDLERGHEVQKWLDASKEVDSFVILDDDSDMVHLSHRLVKTDNKYGLTKRNAKKAIEMLNNP